MEAAIRRFPGLWKSGSLKTINSFVLMDFILTTHIFGVYTLAVSGEMWGMVANAIA